MVKKIQKVGRSKGVLIDKVLLEALGIQELINIEIEDKKLIITKYETIKEKKAV